MCHPGRGIRSADDIVAGSTNAEYGELFNEACRLHPCCSFQLFCIHIDRRRRNARSGQIQGLRPVRRQHRARRLLASRRLCLIVGDDATDRRQNLLHRGLLDLCRLRHLRLHIETILHQSHEGIAGSGYAGRDFHRTSPTCPQIKPARRIARRSCSPSKQPQRAPVRCKDAGHESLSSPRKRYVMATIDCKQSARRIRRRAMISSRLWGNRLGCQRPSGVRTPAQLSRTWW